MENVKTLVISVHSFIDVITNSSSELFVCDKDKSIEFVEKILKKYKVVYFSKVYLYTQEMYDANFNYTKNSCIKFFRDYNNGVHDDYKDTIKDEVIKRRKILEKMQYDEFDFEDCDFRKKSNIGKVVIEGVYINSISDNLENDKFNEMISILNAKIYE